MNSSFPSPRARMPRQRGLRDAERADGVQVEQPLQFGQRDGFHGGVEDFSGVDDDDVDITGGRECRGHAGVIGDVEGQTLGEVEVFEANADHGRCRSRGDRAG